MTNDMQKLSWAKVEKARQALHRTLHGVPLVELKDCLDLELFKPPFPITGCICVQDTPENPCPCTDLIFWLLDPPLEVSRTQRRTDRGDEILAFELPRDARVNVELQIPMKLSDLERIAW